MAQVENNVISKSKKQLEGNGKGENLIVSRSVSLYIYIFMYIYLSIYININYIRFELNDTNNLQSSDEGLLCSETLNYGRILAEYY